MKTPNGFRRIKHLEQPSCANCKNFVERCPYPQYDSEYGCKFIDKEGAMFYPNGHTHICDKWVAQKGIKVGHLLPEGGAA